MALFISQKTKSLAIILALVAVVIETFMVGTLFIMTWKPSRKSYKRYINDLLPCTLKDIRQGRQTGLMTIGDFRNYNSDCQAIRTLPCETLEQTNKQKLT